MPQSFASEKERDYWHMAQDIAYRAGVAIAARDGIPSFQAADRLAEERIAAVVGLSKMWRDGKR